ncbi:MAG: tRNA pseudouridine(55) synthase TruB [Gemmatimonadaceae bacterium]
MLVDKPAGITSHDVVARARRALGVRRIGHHGTLDPFATGLLVLLVGRATRLAPFLSGEPKVYEAEVRFGSETSTDDLTGEIVREAPLPTPESVRTAIQALTGIIEQLPPAVSAKQVDGERAHAAARAGRPLTLRPVTVTVHGWDVHELTSERLVATVRCGTGTYIRALARDLGRATGSAAHLAALRRVASGPFGVAGAIHADDLQPGAPISILPPLDGLPELPRETLDDPTVARIRHGGAAAATVAGELAALVDSQGVLVAIAERVVERWQPRVVLQDPVQQDADREDG